MRCCYIEEYTNHFDHQKAKDDLDDYLQNGIKHNSRPLFSVIDHISLEDLSLLDIGAGVGTIVFELLKRGIRHATHNDLSPAYVEQFKWQVDQLKLGDKVQSKCGDFTNIHLSFDKADMVTLDKVICCYPDYKALVEHSSKKARKWYVINIPRFTWWVFLFMRLEYFWEKYRTGKAFLTYFHPVKEIEKQLKHSGFSKIKEKKQREWVAILFERSEETTLI